MKGHRIVKNYKFIRQVQFLLWRTKCIKRIPTLWKSCETTSAAAFHKFLEKNLGELTALCSTGILNTFGQKSNIFSVWCCTGEFLLGLLKIIITAIFFLTPFADCYLSCDVAYDTWASECTVTLVVQEGKGPP